MSNNYTQNFIDEVKGATNSVTGNADIVTPSAEIVVLNDLQDGIPFSNIVVSGKNLLQYPYNNTTKTVDGITFTDNGDGSITANGTATSDAYFYISLPLTLPKGVYTISDGNNISSDKCRLHIFLYDSPYTTLANSYYKKTFSLDESTKINIRFIVFSGETVDDVIIKPQLELGDTTTEYEPPIVGLKTTLTVNGTPYTVTPNSNPYVVTSDIRQEDGTNTVSVSAGKVSVTGAKRNAALKRIWDKIG